MRRTGHLTTVGVVLLVVGAAGQVLGSGSAIPRFVPPAALVAGLMCLIVAGASTLRARRRSGAADDAVPPAQDRRERRRALSVRLVVAGLALLPLSLVIAVVAGNDVSVFGFLAPAMVAVLVAVVVLVTGRFFVPALVFSILLFLLSVMLAENELPHPESFADFVPALWRVVGAGVAVVAAAVAMTQRRRQALRRATPRQRTAVRIGALALIAASVGSFVLSTTSRTTIARADGAIVVNTLADDFDPEDLRVETGRVRFLLRNEDSYAHTFSIDSLEVDEYIGPRSDRVIAFRIPRDGKYELYCAINGHEDMTGEIEAG